MVLRRRVSPAPYPYYSFFPKLPSAKAHKSGSGFANYLMKKSPKVTGFRFALRIVETHTLREGTLRKSSKVPPLLFLLLLLPLSPQEYAQKNRGKKGRRKNGKERVSSPFCVPNSLWESFLVFCGKRRKEFGTRSPGRFFFALVVSFLPTTGPSVNVAVGNSEVP